MRAYRPDHKAELILEITSPSSRLNRELKIQTQKKMIHKYKLCARRRGLAERAQIRETRNRSPT